MSGWRRKTYFFKRNFLNGLPLLEVPFWMLECSLSINISWIETIVIILNATINITLFNTHLSLSIYLRLLDILILHLYIVFSYSHHYYLPCQLERFKLSNTKQIIWWRIITTIFITLGISVNWSKPNFIMLYCYAHRIE